MSGGDSSSDRKQAYFGKLIKLLEEYPRILIVGADNVGSTHMQKIRMALRGKAVLLMGKNTMIRKAIRGHLQNDAALESLLPHIKGNIGFVFCPKEADLGAIKKLVSENTVSAPARAGAISPCNVVVPAGNTGLEPTQTSFFQALNITTKITRGQIEIVSDVPLIKEGDKVGASESNLLAKLNIRPFSYGLKMLNVYDEGSVYAPHILDLGDELLNKFKAGVRNVAAASLALGIPTLASVPHSIVNGYKKVLALALETPGYETDFVKKFQASASAAAPAPAAKGGKADAAPAAAPAAKKKEPEPEPEEDEEMGFGLFD